MAMAIKQHRSSAASIAEIENKENISPLQDFFNRSGNRVLQQKCRSPLPVGYTRAPLQDITHVISPIKILPDSANGCCGQIPRRLKRARSEISCTDSSVSCKNSSPISQRPIMIVVIEDSAVTEHGSLLNSSTTDHSITNSSEEESSPVLNSSKTEKSSMPNASKSKCSSDAGLSLVHSSSKAEKSSMPNCSKTEKSSMPNCSKTEYLSVQSSSKAEKSNMPNCSKTQCSCVSISSGTECSSVSNSSEADHGSLVHSFSKCRSVQQEEILH